MKELSKKKKHILDAIKHDYLKVNDKGRFYWTVPTSVRRSGQVIVSTKEIQSLKDAGLIKINNNKYEIV